MTASLASIDPTRQRRALIIALTAALALATIMLLMPPPSKFDQLGVSISHGETSGWFAARGPALTRYDPTTDETEAVFHCSHWYCQHAVRLEGDQREALDRPHILLRATGGPFSPTQLDQPFPIGGDTPPGDDITTALAGEWRAYSPWPAAILFAFAAVALAAGIILLSKVPQAVWYASPVAGALALFAARETNWMTLFIFPILGLPLLAMVGGIGALVARKHRSWRWVPWACLTFALVFLPLTLVLNAYFPTAPEL